MTMRSNKAIVNAAGQTITTAGLAAGGALNPEQAKKFIQQTFEATPLSGLVRHELRSAKTGEIDKIGVGRRLLRKKTENTDDGYRSGVKHGKLEYACTPVRLPWEITEETLRENIEGSNYETIVTNLMTRQIGCDREDLCLNGDERYAKVKEFSSSETYAIGDLVAYNKKVYQYTAAHTAGTFNAGEATELGTVDDADFLKVNDGWVKQFKEGGHVVDVSGINSGAMVLDVFYKGLRAVPDKFNNGSLRWLMSPHRRQEWERYILNQAVTAGGIITEDYLGFDLAVTFQLQVIEADGKGGPARRCHHADRPEESGRRQLLRRCHPQDHRGPGGHLSGQAFLCRAFRLRYAG